MADEQLLQSVSSVQQLANMETELEQALERVRARKVSQETIQYMTQFLLS